MSITKLYLKEAEKVNKKIKELIEKNNVSQATLAEIAGVSQAFISCVLKGYKTPSVAVLKRIADYFGVSLDELVSENKPA